ncbi:MAG: hypothetical protein ABIK09_21060 [Pseudomonadota bacterium]
MRDLAILLLILSFAACNDAATDGGDASGGLDLPNVEDTGGVDFTFVDLTSDGVTPDLPPPDGTIDDIVSVCEPGEGCFLDPCVENGECQSGWCVDHMGDGVCTTACAEECPAGWSCQQVAGTDPDVVFICVSHIANLCRPCADAGDCLATGGVEDVCVDYAAEGSFCGAPCDPDDVKSTCPWGFSCQEALTVDGIPTTQCVADAGICPCTAKAVTLALWTPCAVENEWGQCGGKRVCTGEGLTPCDATDPAAELCNALDDDCDGEVDEPNVIDGGYQDLCDDGNGCTEDGCDGAAGCTHAALTGGECVDGDVCTVGDHCEAGICLGSPVACDDGNPCTDDQCDGLGGCVFLANDVACNDGDSCTVADQCDEAVCAGVPVSCDCQADADCAGLEDGDLCNGTLVCDTGALPFQCEVAPDTVVTCPAPPPGPGQTCLAAACDPEDGTCGLVPASEGFLCDDGDPCTVGEACVEGACADGVAPNCNDGNPCTDDGCAAPGGCVHVPNDLPCSDGDVCTLDDHCSDGLCVGGSMLGCDDGDPCTVDLCDVAVGCQHEPSDGDLCNDGNACTIGDHCVAGACVFGLVAVCDDGNLCTTDSCSPQTGCVYTLNTAPCDDGDLCTVGDHCHLGGCIASGALSCDDGNVCTDDACLAATGCAFSPNAAACDDGDPCTQGDHCAGGWCLSTTKDCDDDNPCTDDACGSAGCTNTPNADPCPGGLCAGGVCVCQPACAGKDCGDDGCGGSCGVCTGQDLCLAGHCQCQPACDGKNCGGDGCGGSCGVCTGQDLCVVGLCQCQPDCLGLDCGEDGCGGLCGTCQGGDTCVAGACVGAIGKRVFVTSTLTSAGLGGVSGADSYCQSRAGAAGLGGSWRAWVSLSGSPVTSRFNHASVPYKLLDGAVIASNWADLTDGTLQHAIDRDENGGAVGSGYIWTATKPNGSYNSDSWGGCGGTLCGGWTIGGTCNSGSGGFGGDSGKVDAQWTDTVCGCCNNQWRLYCFEQ